MGGIALGPEHQGRPQPWKLRPGHEHFRLDRLSGSILPDVACNADDLSGNPLIVVGKDDSLADRIAVGKVLLSEPFIDDDYSRRVRGVPSFKPAAGNQTGFENLEVLGRHGTVADHEIAIRKRPVLYV